METLIFAVIVWLISPIPLTVLYIIARKKKKKQEEMLLHLFMQQRMTAEELTLAGVKLPNAAAAVPQMQPQQTAVLPSPAPFLPMPESAAPPADPEQTLADAAARAARIAEAELTGKPLSEIPVPAQNETPAADASAVTPAAEEETPESDIEQILSGASALPETAQTGEETAVPEAASVSAEALPEQIPAENTAAPDAADMPEKAEPAAAFSAQPAAAYPQPAPSYQAYRPKPAGLKVSAITVMLSVGVLLIISAGLIFVRTAWESLGSFGRLATLAAGSVLFFGTSALARRVWKLERTGMAFFTLGAAFLPISVWAAGYLHLLGDGLSGDASVWRTALSAAAFTVIAVIAVKMYQQIGWAIAALCGLAVTYSASAAGIVPRGDIGDAVFLILIACYALAMCLFSRILRQKQILPIAVGRVIEPYAVIVTAIVSVTMLSSAALTKGAQLSSAAVFLTAIAYFTPAMTERLKQTSAIPASILSVLGFGQLLNPFYHSIFTIHSDAYERTYPVPYLAMLLTTCALLWLILLLTNSLPEQTRKGYFYAAFGLTALHIPLLLSEAEGIMLIVPAASAVLLAVWIFAAHKKPAPLISYLVTAQSWMLTWNIGRQICTAFRTEPTAQELSKNGIVFAGLFILCFLIFVLTKKHRTAVSDLLFTVSAAAAALVVTSAAPASEPLLRAGGVAVTVLMTALFWFMALRHDTVKPVQYAYAVLTPLTLFVFAVILANNILIKTDSVLVTIGWSIVSIGIGMVTYLTTKRRFHNVRRLLFALSILPPLIIAVFGEVLDSGNWIVLQQLICAAAAAGLWILFANRGFHKLEITAFGVMLLLLTESTVYLVRDHVYDGKMNFTVWMTAAVWMIAFGVISLAVSKRILLFVGNSAIPAVMQYAVPLTVLVLSSMLLGMEPEVWENFYFVFTFGLCFLAWFVTKKSQIILPAVSCLALVFSLEALRRQATWCSDGLVAVVLLCFAGMTLLMPYLGTVLREAEDDPADQRRTWVLTGLGGIMPFWLLEAASYGTESGDFSKTQVQWMAFFVPVLLAGYILHFAKLAKKTETRNMILAISAALGMIAFWMQPLVDVKDTYLEGKLHILPMIAFGIVIRHLYDEKVGGGFLFGIGVYSMLRLTVTAIATEDAADLITLLAVALVMFVASFYIRQKKWFLLGGISLVLTAAYMHMKLTDGTQWWVYLLLTGLVLIVVAASNEMLKQRGDSLKQRAGRLWEDWTW
ncbi:MAG: hypothetical protein IKQ91_05490 [Oscillospiraceae bacterium]|nr:hypothetical protein [Oscillospiraceae bacterium]